MNRPEGIITPERLRSRYDYDAETGKFTWKHRPVSDFPNEGVWKAWNTRFAGKPAFLLRKNGYAESSLHLGGRQWHIQGHVAAWAITFGRMPTSEIDHRNRNPSDNRLANLREATRGENCRNVRMPGKHLTGARPYGRRWEARISCDGVAKQIGIYQTEADAHEAYVAESLRLHGEFSSFADLIRKGA